ncbi:MAG: anthranilate phosphoribosyltransferase [Verrucomicrobiota bacterium]
MLDQLIIQLCEGAALSDRQVAAAVAGLVDETIAAETKAEFLTALARKGETAAEIAAFARDLRRRAVPVPLDAATRQADILDIVGTGGDRLGTFNISTCAAIVTASAGVLVAKHGNRAVTSKIGSADVIEALGIPLDPTPERAAALLREHGFAFLFAPKYHPAFQHIAPARKLCAARGQRTIFNLLGPLLNPARPSLSLVGVPRPELCAPFAHALQQLGLRRGMVVSGRVDAGPGVATDYLDEFSILGPTTVAEFHHDRGFGVSAFDPMLVPRQRASLEDLRGGDREVNADIIRRILRGEERGPKRDAVLLNAGAALFIAGKTRAISDGWELAAELIDSGRAQAKLVELTSGH